MDKDMRLGKGFTLIELLVTIGVLAVVAAGILAAINPLEKLRQASDARAISDIGALATAAQSYAAQSSGYYPPNINAMVTSGELAVLPAPPNATYTAYATDPLPAACTTACTSVKYSTQLKATKYSATPFWVYCSSNNKAGPAVSATTCQP